MKRERIRALQPLDEPGPIPDLRVRQMRARDLLRGDIDDVDLQAHVEDSVLTTTLDKVLNWGRANAMFPATFGLACCAIEMMSIVSPRYDMARFGAEAMRASPRQADFIILSGRVSIKMAPVVRRIYDQMLEPKWAISMGACSSSGGMFANYAVVQGADKFMPVDIHVPGCPPRPEALMYGFNKLQKLILGNPDQGWRQRYNAVGTEEWARDLGTITPEARDAYERARQVAHEAEQARKAEAAEAAERVEHEQERVAAGELPTAAADVQGADTKPASKAGAASSAATARDKRRF